MRTLITADPNVDRSDYRFSTSPWRARWVGHPDEHGQAPVVIAYRCRFALPSAATVRVHVSADERYELFVDGWRVGRGPERGDRDNWFYETYDLDLAAGEHLLVARTWWLGPNGPAPFAQVSVRPAFWLMAEGEPSPLLDTGVAPWQCLRLDGYSFHPPATDAFTCVGARTRVDGRRFPWGFERGGGEGWRDVAAVSASYPKSLVGESPLDWLLRPALLPPMLDQPVPPGKTRHVQAVPSLEVATIPVMASEHLPDEAAGWDGLLAADQPLTIPSHTRRRVLIDLGDYYCAYPQLLVSGGAGAAVRVQWAESLFHPHPSKDASGNDRPGPRGKGDRGEIEGKVFRGLGDRFDLDGGEGRLYEPLWWEAGRYVQVVVETSDQPLTIRALTLRETRYPLEFGSTFTCSDPRLEQVIKPALRTLQMCMHETYFDCPYYEQLMYAGDTRTEALTTYATAADARLPRKAVELFDLSRSPGGLTSSRYPTHIRQTIPPFSLWWIGMLSDYAMWRGEMDFVARRMPGARAVLDAWRSKINHDGVCESPAGWNFVDWVRTWHHGIPPAAHHGPSGILNWHFVMILGLAADLEELLGEPELAARNRRTADTIARGADALFWDERRGLFADDPARQHFSEHAQCLALLSGRVDPAKRERVASSLFSDPDLSRTTIYFTHYLFEVCRLTGRMDVLFERLGLWFDLPNNGFVTCYELPEPTRSDCHAWGAHPVFHYFATILGIRPTAPALSRVEVRPQLGPLTSAKGRMVHPRGTISVEVRREKGRLIGSAELPEGVEGVLLLADRRIVLRPGAPCAF